MNVHQLRTTAEKILLPIAVIISAAVWILIAVGHYYAFLPQQPTLKGSCVYSYQDEEDGGTYYYATSLADAKKYGYESECLPQNKLSDEAKKEALASLETTQTSSTFLPVIDFYILFFLLFSYITNALAMARIRLNGVRISPTQYAAFYKIYEQTAQELGLQKIPNAYIIHQGGILNAFAIKISHKKMVVFYAELIENLVEGHKFEELHAVAAHELTHVKLKHINYNFFLIPFRILPFVGSWFSRVRELSADRGAMFIVKDYKIVAQALLKLVTGKFVAKEINMEEYTKQPYTEHGFFIWLSKITATHPPVPERIRILQNLKSE